MKTQNVLATSKTLIKAPLWVEISSAFENWYLKKFFDLNPSCERIVRFYTMQDGHYSDFKIECPEYTYDVFNTLCEDFNDASSEIAQELLNISVLGEYYYDVKIKLNYFVSGNPYLGYENDCDYSWEILKTDNPRCPYGSHQPKRNVSYLKNTHSCIEIKGYSLSGDYKNMGTLLENMVNNVVLVHSKLDAKAFLKISKFLGVKIIVFKDRTYTNVPTKSNHFSNQYFGYHIINHNGKAAVEIVNADVIRSGCYSLLDIDEFIVKRSVKARLQDFMEQF